MSKEQKSDTTNDTTKTAKPQSSTGNAETGNAEVQEKIDKETAQGFRGTEVDPTPNKNYTVDGVISGAPTPETDPGAANTARANTNVGLTGVEAAARDKEAVRANAANTRKRKETN